MVIDTSALVAILQDEPERHTFNKLIGTARSCCMSTASFVELSMIIESRFGADGIRDLDLFMIKAGIKLIPVDEEHALLARKGFRDYGKGRHPAGLNFGDCFSYALAKSRGEPLLFKGDDFPKTDVAFVG
ncbi:MAG: type II toxin-antitoxin system VapC family toxin [Candidatus Thiodiazotropha sp. (ex Dulcina madagascariensis)]|nr:type II toxin-antitoxin system VapC family toxin [Candidatus Thiodiazotropha sp. (ex Epidulcina cf. delphinae)]MCU7922934.1 type II toxin-antitoxin system VapC family toxin [Candidatus Thiodiazotropha sp. (ex Dulcina madagascariensis)]MCU7926099.1 type II toxin-antitoxin system VapC family toxin [Candidatus Thiodiazotropha sp. (ex Dulcina madagascariensis)]